MFVHTVLNLVFIIHRRSDSEKTKPTLKNKQTKKPNTIIGASS